MMSKSGSSASSPVHSSTTRVKSSASSFTPTNRFARNAPLGKRAPNEGENVESVLSAHVEDSLCDYAAMDGYMQRQKRRRSLRANYQPQLTGTLHLSVFARR